MIHLPNLRLTNLFKWVNISIIVSRHIDRFIRTNMTALELNCSVTLTYGMFVDVGDIKTYKPAFPKLEIWIMRSYPIKSRALFNNLSKVQGSCSQMVRNSVGSFVCGFIGVTCRAKLVPKLFFFVSGFSLNYYAMPNIFPRTWIIRF